MIITRTSKNFLMVGVASLLAMGGGIDIVQANSTVHAFNQPLNPTSEIQIYGQVPQPNQIQKGYIVYQRFGDQVIGAAYQPRSEFDCFVGDLKNHRLDIDFLSPQGQTNYAAQIELSDLHNLNTPSADDKRILNTCLQQTDISLNPATKP